MIQSKDTEVSVIKERLSVARDSITNLKANDYFSIENDQDAQDYFYNKNLDYPTVIAKVKEDLTSLNANKNGNPLVPYEPIDGKIFIINKVKVLNHRWIIAEYSNADLWGQVLIKYFYNDDKPADFETLETVVYERQAKK
uniref:hydrolase n=1 Tax=Flavobacterium sp. TaxID=239 RepID=UPI0040493039